MRTGIYFGEKVEILFERDGEFCIRYVDGLEEFVDLSAITDIKRVKTKKTPKAHKKTKNIKSTERKKARFERHFGSRERVEQINAEPCVICQGTPSENAHIKSRGASGTYKNIIPLCRNHHSEQHQIGIISFAEKYQLDLEEIAKYYAEKFPL